MSTEQQSRRLTMVVILSVVTAIAVITLCFIALPPIISAASNSEEVKQGTDLQACRALANIAVTNATADLDTARADLEVSTSLALTALSNRDDATFTQAVAQIAVAREAVAHAKAGRKEATDRYVQQVRRSQEDPAGFLRECTAGP